MLNCGKDWGRHSLALLCILLVDLLWVSSSELTQTIFHNSSYDHPYFLSYFNTSLFSVYALFFIPLFYYTIKRNFISQSLTNTCDNNSSSNYQSVNLVINKVNTNKSRASHKCCIKSIPSHKLPILATFKLSVIFCIIWFCMTYTFNLSLNETSVASNSIISSMSGPFCLILSFFFLENYNLTICNILGVIITTCGSSLIGYLDSFKSNNNNHNSVLGDILAVISASIYSFYVTGLKIKIGDETKVNMFLFFGFIGIINCIVLWPGLLILNALKMELFVWPNHEIWLLLIINGLLTIFSDYLWAQAILLSNPVVATVGLSCMMPLAILADEIFRHIHHSVYYWLGAMCVWIGFVCVNIDMNHKRKKDSSAKENEPENHSNNVQHRGLKTHSNYVATLNHA